MSFVLQYTETKKRSEQYAQNFDRKKIMVTKGGKTYNVYDAIQAAREDTEIYPTLEKYGNLQVMERDVKLIYADISDAKDLMGLYNQELKMQEIFENLPSKERNIFDNDIHKFREFGLEYYEKKAKGEMEQAEKIREEMRNRPQKVEIVNNDGGKK